MEHNKKIDRMSLSCLRLGRFTGALMFRSLNLKEGETDKKAKEAISWMEKRICKAAQLENLFLHIGGRKGKGKKWKGEKLNGNNMRLENMQKIGWYT